MNLRDLRYLIAVADHQHFGRAAESCHVSQPALSMQIKKLEDELRVQLFERTNKKVLLTTVGHEILARARRVIREADEITDIAATHQDPLSGTLRLGAFPTLAPYIFPQIVPRIARAMPRLKLYLVEEKTADLVARLLAGQIDAALLALPIEEEGLEVEPLFDDPFLLAAPPGHPLGEKKLVDIAGIASERLLLLEEGHCLRAQALELCGLMGASEHSDFRATSLETLRQMVASGVGITLIPALAARPDDRISYVPFAEPIPSRTIGLVWRATTARNECLRTIATLCKQPEKETDR